MKKHIILFFILMLLGISNTFYAQQLPKGQGMFTFTDYAPFAGRPVDVHYYIPPGGDPVTMPVVFVLEGADRGYDYLLESWKKSAEARKFVLVLPHFDLSLYPLTDYQETGVLTPDRKNVKDPSLQTSALIDEIFKYLRKHTDIKSEKYTIYGHSAGGQFIQRFMLFYDSPYVEKAIIGSPGWYTFPDKEQVFPYGTRDIMYIDNETIKKYLSKNIVLQLGMGDTIRESYLRKTPEAELQGANRLERGRNFYNYIQKIAAENNWPCHWQKQEVPDVGHQSALMGEKALPLLLSDSIRALFIGNSYTFFNDMPRMVQAIAHSNGMPLSVKMITHGGWTLNQHANSKETLDAIKEGGWDFVVLQEQSQAPSREREWVLKNVYPYAQALDSVRQLFSPKGKTVFYMTWGHRIETYPQMQQRLAESYLDMTKRFQAWCAPVGITWKRVFKEKPGITLHDPDNSHPNLQGSYLAANVFYSTFFQTSYNSTYYAGLDKEEATYLQRTAQEVVLSNLPLWNIRPVPQREETTNRFYPDPDKKYNSPTLNKPVEEGIASLYEINSYLEELTKKHSDKITISSLGTTPERRNIPIIYLNDNKGKDKLNVWIQAGLHGNEPAGTESICILTDYLLNDNEGRQLLSHLNIALVPVANVDGYAIQQRRSSIDLDLNRDQTKLADPVSVLLKKAFTEWSPQVALDIHEYTPWRKDYDMYTGKKVAIFQDILFLPTGHPNIPVGIRDFSVNTLQKQAEKALEENGYTWGYYFTPNLKEGRLFLSKGARSPQSSSTSYALSNAISMFIEIRGIGLGCTSFARRADAGFTVAKTLLETCYQQKKQIAMVVKQAIKETEKKQTDISVVSKPKETMYTARFVDLHHNDTFSLTLPATNSLHNTTTLKRKRPEIYILSDTCKNAVRILETLGVKTEKTNKQLTVEVESYSVTEYEEATVLWEKIYPVKVKTVTRKIKKNFPPGSYIIPLNQKNANYAVTLLEPESMNGFISFQVIKTKAGDELPIYRAY